MLENLRVTVFIYKSIYFEIKPGKPKAYIINKASSDKLNIDFEASTRNLSILVEAGVVKL